MKGSIWRKWDLHIHTPKTKLSNGFAQIGSEDIWKTYCDKIHNSDVDAFGITDYFCCENYFKFLSEYNKYYPSSIKIFFANIEFRLIVSVNKAAEEINIHVLFSNKVTKSKIDEFLTKLNTTLTDTSGSRINCKGLLATQFESATINHIELITCLNNVFGKSKPYMIVAAANNAGLRPARQSPRKLMVTDEIDKICDAFFGGRQNTDYYLDSNRYETAEIAKPKPVMTGSDAHSFPDVDNFLGKYVTRLNATGKEEILKDITWIKADLTFEGLKQILFEPKHRIKIDDQKPRRPNRRIETIKFNFPSNTSIKLKASTDTQDFCLKRLNQDIHFSDYFTCIIGGRGTGKSTIINLLAEKLGVETDFFNSSEIIVDGKQYDLNSDKNSYIQVTGTNEIEFVSQGKIERLAESNELTKLVFENRIKEIESRFYELNQEYEDLSLLVKENVDILSSWKKLSDEKAELDKDRKTNQKIIDSINNERYKAISRKIKEIKKKLTELEASKKKYSLLISRLREVLVDFPKIKETKNQIDERINSILETIDSVDEIIRSEDQVTILLKHFKEIEQENIALNSELTDQTQKLRKFFEEKGTSEEAIKDSQFASESLSRITNTIKEIDFKIENSRNKYQENLKKTSALTVNAQSQNELIITNLETINNKLKIEDDNVLDIKFDHQFDKEKYKDQLFKQFYSQFSEYHIANTSENKIKEFLFSIDPNSKLLKTNYQQFKKQLEASILSNNTNVEANYVKTILAIFKRRGNYLIYLELIKNNLYNVTKYVKINGFYGKRKLESCSFGQRCTAVIVTLLMTGVKPLVIDEPEAHLDNKLVADYLVELVKEKQMDRQIIFASHNSNFVINGDSGLIHILEIPRGGVYTDVLSTTIENKSNRESLLKLEGGEVAFKTRESKYGI